MQMGATHTNVIGTGHEYICSLTCLAFVHVKSFLSSLNDSCPLFGFILWSQLFNPKDLLKIFLQAT